MSGEPRWKQERRPLKVGQAEALERSRGMCEWAIAPDCTRYGQEFHHKVKRWNDLAHRSLTHLCSACHRHVHEDEGRARRMGWLKGPHQ